MSRPRRRRKPLYQHVCPNGGHTYLGKQCGVCWVMGLSPDALATHHKAAKVVLQPQEADDGDQNAAMTYYEENV